ncbi:hypothetical protein BCF46_3196 [Litoreibacter meonggei]|uniref:Uncharacterized protein n=1 Tax=Litoreibacter meonggei TaxID=1049199 RepID=A0A497VX14_9RHOB|nr:hypothetical protein [Litoreibacter meonggei]RLJ41403.1 hypothetical protein BCF46_3196 [Litoreibacter meonggei]
MYEGDSFFTLTGPQQAGLLLLSVALACGWIYASWRLSARRPLVLRLAIGIVLFFGFVWLSPQIYYQYYRLIIDGLPAQFVVGWPLGPLHVVRLLTFQFDANLSAHSQGLLGWALIIVAALRR